MTSLDSPARAGQLVRARLGRDPQDMLEAAVVLEAWAGIPATEALAAGREIVRTQPPVRLRSRSSLSRAPAESGFASEAIAFLVAVVAIAWWAVPLAQATSARVVQHALIVALPLTMTLTWLLSRRYLSRRHGLAHLARRPWAMALAAAALVAVPWLALGTSGEVAGLLAVTWTGGALLIRRRWGLGYAAVVLVATAVLDRGLPAVGTIAATAALTTALVMLAMATLTSPTPAALGSWLPTVTAAAIGAGLGVILVADPSVHWSIGSVPAAALVPSAAASLWSGYHLWQVQRVIVRSLAGVEIGDDGPRGLHRAPLRILGGAVVRFVLVCGLLSGGLLAGAAYLHVTTSGVTVLAGFALVALASLPVNFLASVGRERWALLSVAAAIAGELVVAHVVRIGVAGDGLIVAGALAAAVALPAAVAVLSRPAATLATTLWIP